MVSVRDKHHIEEKKNGKSWKAELSLRCPIYSGKVFSRQVSVGSRTPKSHRHIAHGRSGVKRWVLGSVTETVVTPTVRCSFAPGRRAQDDVIVRGSRHFAKDHVGFC
jgi:hypothetical protein